MKRQIVCVRFRLPASLRIAWLIMRAWRPTRLVAHLALELGPRRQRRDGVDRDDVDRARAHEHVGDLERLLAVVGLGDEELVDVDADPLRVQRVHRVLGVDERAHAAELLRLGEDVVDERGLTGGLRAEDLDDAPARHAADAEREVERQRAGGDRVDLHLGALVAHAHDAALAELALDLGQCTLQGVVAGLGGLGGIDHGHEVGAFLWSGGAARYARARRASAAACVEAVEKVCGDRRTDRVRTGVRTRCAWRLAGVPLTGGRRRRRARRALPASYMRESVR